jgi:hypothetical protein
MTCPVFRENPPCVWSLFASVLAELKQVISAVERRLFQEPPQRDQFFVKPV